MEGTKGRKGKEVWGGKGQSMARKYGGAREGSKGQSRARRLGAQQAQKKKYPVSGHIHCGHVTSHMTTLTSSHSPAAWHIYSS